MPTIQIHTNIEEPKSIDSFPPFLRFPDGLVMIEIQGTINHPQTVSEASEGSFVKTRDGKDAVRIGELVCSGDKVELSVGANQKLIGNVVKLDKPLGILKFPKLENPGNISDQHILDTLKVDLVEVVRYKLVFKNRPVPNS